MKLAGPTNTISLDSPRQVERLSLERRWRQFGWMLVAVVLLAASLVISPAAPFHRVTQRSTDGAVRVEYARWVQSHAGTEFQLTHTLPPGEQKPDSRPLQVLIERSLFDSAELVSVTPPPTAVEPHGPYLLYEFPSTSFDQYERVPVADRIVFRYEFERAGACRFTIKLPWGAEFAIQQWVLP